MIIERIKPHIPRILIGLIALWNLQAALVFILWPDAYAPGFELSGIPGAVAVRGMGILFVMWTVPYLIAAWRPVEYFIAVQIALVMQAIGVFGEMFIFFSLPAGHQMLNDALFRFIGFDGAGLILLMIVYYLITRETGGPNMPGDPPARRVRFVSRLPNTEK